MTAGYLSNIPANVKFAQTKKKNSFRVLLGNSRSKSNNHVEILKILKNHENSIGEIVCPLSYGKEIDYAKEVSAVGRSLFGKKFIPLKDLLPLEEYLKVLASVDVAVFGHKRQEAVGNTINLLAMGKLVFMDSQSTTFTFLKDLGVDVRSIEELNFEKVMFDDTSSKLILDIFSFNRFQENWNNLCESKN